MSFARATLSNSALRATIAFIAMRELCHDVLCERCLFVKALLFLIEAGRVPPSGGFFCCFLAVLMSCPKPVAIDAGFGGFAAEGAIWRMAGGPPRWLRRRAVGGGVKVKENRWFENSCGHRNSEAACSAADQDAISSSIVYPETQ